MAWAEEYMRSDDKALNEHISLAIASWSIGLAVTITQTERQQLHMDILAALEHVGAIEKS